MVLLNVDNIVQAIRSIYFPGDTIKLKILKQGKGPTQGVGYLEDGTMVVLEEEKKYVGVERNVSSCDFCVTNFCRTDDFY